MAGQIVPNQENKDTYVLDAIYDILSYFIFERLRNQEAISYYAGATHCDDKISGNIAAYATCKKSDFKKAKKAINEEFSKISNGKIDDAMVDYIIKATKKSFVLNHTGTIEKANALRTFWSQGDIYKINSYFEDLEKITPDQVRDVAKKYICPDKLTYVALGNL
jgi:predicted Zn-dependent peptidase